MVQTPLYFLETFLIIRGLNPAACCLIWCMYFWPMSDGVSSQAHCPLKWHFIYCLCWFVICLLIVTCGSFWLLCSASSADKWLHRPCDETHKYLLLFNPCTLLTLNVKMTWFKNIWEERQAPRQILFGQCIPLSVLVWTLQCDWKAMMITACCCLINSVLTMLSWVSLKASSTVSSSVRSRGSP